MPDPMLQCPHDDLAVLCQAIQARLGHLPDGVTVTLNIGAGGGHTVPSVPTAPPVPEADMPIWYTAKDLASLFGVRVTTVQKWVREGRFPGVRRLPNGAIRVPKVDAEAVLAANPESPATASAARDATTEIGPVRPRRASGESEPRFDGWRRQREVTR